MVNQQNLTNIFYLKHFEKSRTEIIIEILHIARSSNGRTEAFEAFNPGSNPGRASPQVPHLNG